MTPNPTPTLQPLTGCFEPSAIQQLPDGRFLVVEDEKHHPFSLITVAADGRVDHVGLSPGLFQMFSSFWTLDDLEGLAGDRAGQLYAITSHSRDDDGDEKKAREKLVRFRIEGDKVVEPKVVDDLKAALTARHPVLAEAAKLRKVKVEGGLNIEALEMSPDSQRLLIGFRSPLDNGHAIIASVENPGDVFDHGKPPQIGPELERLDLGGQGIRGLSYLPSLGEYLVVGGPASTASSRFDLWLWSGRAGAPVRRVQVPGLQGVDRAEGVSPAVIDGVERLIVVMDDGDRAKGRFAHYLLLDRADLQIAA